MLIVISPAKTLDLTPQPRPDATQPRLLDESETLIKKLRTLSKPKLAGLMGISPNLAALNAERYQSFATPFTQENAKPALLAFRGDVYQPLETSAYGPQEFAHAQKHLRILSGLYGLLRPLDLMQPYRLEMGTKLATRRGEDLYDFWGDRITDLLSADLAQAGGPLINLASQEYFGAIRPKRLKAPILTIHFKETKGDKLQTIGLFAKRARGTMVNHILRHHITQPDALKSYNQDGYIYQPDLSTPTDWIFTRG